MKILLTVLRSYHEKACPGMYIDFQQIPRRLALPVLSRLLLG